MFFDGSDVELDADKGKITTITNATGIGHLTFQVGTKTPEKLVATRCADCHALPNAELTGRQRRGALPARRRIGTHSLAGKVPCRWRSGSTTG